MFLFVFVSFAFSLLITWTDKPRIPLFFNMTLLPWINGSWRFEAKQCPYLQGSKCPRRHFRRHCIFRPLKTR